MRFYAVKTLSTRALLVAVPIFVAAHSLHSQAPKPASSDSQFQIGTSLEATADPTIPRPSTKPCVVTLLSNQAFENFNNAPYTFTPPSACPGPWARVVLTADFSIQPGVQYDRTGQLFLGNANIYFGTTAEPLQTQTDTWHVERDLTDYSALLKTTQTGYASLGNIVGADGLTSIIFGTFKLEFYPANFINPAPLTPDLVLPLPDNGSALLNNGTPELAETFTLPANVEKAYIDVIAQSQNEEEQWFLSLPDTLSPDFGVGGNTAFRQVDISIDGTAAGVAPVFPWIYTGGVDPGLWIPIPGIQTLNLLPYRVDLTPFAGVLSNGQPHTIGVTVFNAYQYFTTVANLLIYQDHGSKKVTGEVTENSLTAPSPVLVNNTTTDASGDITGTVTVTSAQSFAISGYANTSHGRVTTKIDGKVNFSNSQQLVDTATQEGQNVVETSTVDQKTTTQDGFIVTGKETNVSYPFNLNYLETYDPTTGNIGQVTTVGQNFLRNETQTLEGFPIFQSSVSNSLTSGDTATFIYSNGGYYLGPNTGQTSKQTYIYKDSFGGCYSRTLTAANNELATVADQKDCQPGFHF